MYRIAIIGAGNLAWHLAPTLQRHGHAVTVISRRAQPERRWPCPVGGWAELARTPPVIVIMAVPDDAIAAVSKQLFETVKRRTAVLHTSGATSMKKIDNRFLNRGVLWPIRSLAKGELVDSWRNLPIAYEASNPDTLGLVRELVDKLTWTSYELDSAQRAQLHLAAVFSNNFVSWMYQIAYDLTEQRDIPFTALLPIIRNTAERQSDAPPRLSQTGAAARGDQQTMDRHLKLLNGHPEWSRLYRLMSRLIREGTQVDPDD